MQVRDIRLVEKAGASTPLGAPAEDSPHQDDQGSAPKSSPQLASRATSLGTPQFVVSILHDPTTGHLLIKVSPPPH